MSSDSVFPVPAELCPLTGSESEMPQLLPIIQEKPEHYLQGARGCCCMGLLSPFSHTDPVSLALLPRPP